MEDDSAIDLYTYCHDPQYQRVVFDNGPLPSGLHTFTVRLTGKKNGNHPAWAYSTTGSRCFNDG